MTNSPKVAVVTSRLRRLIDPNAPWVSALRAVLRKIGIDGATLIVGQGTAGADFIRRAAERLEIPYVVASPEPNDSAPDLLLPDHAVMSNAEIVYVLGLRTDGNIHRLLRHRLQRQTGIVVLIDAPELQPESAKQELSELGAQTWKPPAELCRPFERKIASVPEPTEIPAAVRDNVYQIVPFPSDGDWQFLTHTTRSCPGPWPDESFETYADSLLESRPDADHSPLGTLRKIACERRLIASSKTIRGGHAVVSFSACPLGQLPTLHRFRPHLVRWDFEPYGLCIRRDWLLERGARPVCYGSESLWESLAAADQPFFQRAIGESNIDWSVEREWRHRGNLDLTELTPDDVLLFVPNFEAAKSLAQVTDWPLTLWPDEAVQP